MMKRTSRRWSAIAVSAACLAAGAGAAMAAGAVWPANGTAASGTTAKTAKAGKHPGHKAHHGQRAEKLLRRAVHLEAVVPTRTGFAKLTSDRGVVTAIAGNQVTLTEGTKQKAYGSLVIVVPAGARVRVGGRTGSLSDVKVGMRVRIVSIDGKTRVIARAVKAG